MTSQRRIISFLSSVYAWSKLGKVLNWIYVVVVLHVVRRWNALQGNYNHAGDDVDKSEIEEELNVEAAKAQLRCSHLHKYDVFINHRGPDVKLTFAARLDEALRSAGLFPFLDAKSIGQGRHVFSSIDEALNDASVHVAIFSRRYAESKYCLEELWDMLRTQKLILPVFYDVQPDHLRCVDSGPFAKGFQKHRKRGRIREIRKWAQALHEVADRRGFRQDEVAGDENQLVRSIVREVLQQMPVKLHSEKRLFGIEESVEEALQKLDAMGDQVDVGILGVVGMGGIGKTTLADALYRQLLSRGDVFKVHSFLKDVRSSAPLQLQRQLVRDVACEDMATSAKSYRRWFDEFKSQKILIIVDDIDTEVQFRSLIPEVRELGPGSRIVVTSRHRDVLNCCMKPLDQYHKPATAMFEVKELSRAHSLQLFNWHAFYSKEPSDEGFRDLAQKVADACGGHPLALEVIGASLFDKKDPVADRLVWTDAIKALKENDDIQDKLRISYDNLRSDGDKAMFRDIACLLMGMRQEVALEIWMSCQSCASGYCKTSKGPHLALRRLVDKSLVRLDSHGPRTGFFFLSMHDHLRDLGRSIVVKEEKDQPGRRTHLWDAATAAKVLRKNQGTDKVRGLSLSAMDTSHSIPTHAAEQFASVDELHLLVLDGCAVVGEDFSRWSQELRWLQWRSFRRTELPSHLSLSNLAVLDLSDSPILSRLWQEDAPVEFPHLQRLILKNCRGLEGLPQNIGQRLPRVKTMEMENCSLIEVLPDSVGQLKYLEHLILSGCENLTTLPNTTGNLIKLGKLMLNDCIKLKYLPQELGKATNLEELNLTNCTSLHELPPSLRGLRKLKELHMRSVPLDSLPEGFGQLSCLRTLSVSHVIALPEGLEGLQALIYVNLADCKLQGPLPSSFGAFTALTTLNLQGTQVVTIEALPQGVLHLNMLNCRQLTRLPCLAEMQSLKYLNLCNCGSLTGIQGLESVTSLEEINLTGCTAMVQSELRILHTRALRMCCLSGSKVGVLYDHTWSEKEPVSQLISYYDDVMGYLPDGMVGRLQGVEWACDQVMDTTISSKAECVALIISVVAHDQGWSDYSCTHGLYNSNCFLEVWIMRDNVLVNQSKLFALRHADNLNQVYLLTLRRHHPVVRMLKFGDKVCVYARSAFQAWRITLREGAVCVIHGENDDQIAVVNSKLLSKARSKELSIKLGGLVLADNASSLMKSLQTASIESDEIYVEPSIDCLPLEECTLDEHIRDIQKGANIHETQQSIENLEKQAIWTIPPIHGKYDWTNSWKLPRAGEGVISFTVEGTNDVHVAISTSLRSQIPMYEIVIGGWCNTKTALRRSAQGPCISVVPKGLLNPRLTNQLWVSIDKTTSIIQIGRGKPEYLEDMITYYMDRDFISEAQFVSFSTWDVPITYSNIVVTGLEHIQAISTPENQQKEIPLELVMNHTWTIVPLKGLYTWAPYWKLPSIGRGVLSFTAEGTNGVHVAISARPDTMNPMYEIVIGGGKNAQSVIRRASLGPDVCIVEAGMANDASCFWVSIDDRTNIIQVGKGDPRQNAFCIWKDPDFLAASLYFSFTTWSSPITYSNVGIATLP